LFHELKHNVLHYPPRLIVRPQNVTAALYRCAALTENFMTRTLQLKQLFACLIFGALLVTAPARAYAQQKSPTVPPDKKEVLRKARLAYYSLSDAGMTEFACAVTPDWSGLLAEERKNNPAAADKATATLNQLRFNASLGADGKIHLTHNNLSTDNKAMVDALNKIFAGMEQMTAGFFDTWKLFMMSPPFPSIESEYQLENLGPQYRLTYKEDTADVVTTMDPDFSVSQLKVTSPEFNSAIWPKFTRTPKGLLFTSYEATYFSNKPDESTQLKVAIGYQEVSGLELVQKLDLRGSYGGNPFGIKLTFSDCTVKKGVKKM